MNPSNEGEPWLGGRVTNRVRPYTMTGGRVRPSRRLDLVSLVTASTVGPSAELDPEHAQAFALCQEPISVGEITAQLQWPLHVAKIVVCDLLDCGALITRAPPTAADPTKVEVLQEVLEGLQRL